jgi:hypothetical protein
MKAAIAIGTVVLALTTATLWAQHPTEAKPSETKPTTTSTSAPKPSTTSTSAAKPAPTRPATAESAAERIMRRLDEAFPKKADAKSEARPRATETAATTNTEARTSGTGTANHASKRLTLNWRIALQWPEELCGTPIVK